MICAFFRWFLGIALIFAATFASVETVIADTEKLRPDDVAEVSRQWQRLMDQMFDDLNIDVSIAVELADEASKLVEGVNQLSFDMAESAESLNSFCSVFRPYAQMLISISRDRLQASMLFGPDYTGHAPLEVQEHHTVAISSILDARSKLALSPAGLCASDESYTVEINWLNPYNRLVGDMIRTLPRKTVVQALNISRQITTLAANDSVPTNLQDAMDAFRSLNICGELQSGKSLFLKTIQIAADFLGETFEVSDAGLSSDQLLELGARVNFRELSDEFWSSVKKLKVRCALIEGELPKRIKLQELSISSSIFPNGLSARGIVADEVDVENIQLGGTLDFSNSTLQLVRVSGIYGFTKIPEAPSVQPPLRRLIEEVYDGIEPASLSFYDSRISGDTHLRELNAIERISFRSARLGAWTKIELVDGVNRISLDRSTGRRIYIENALGDTKRMIADSASRIELEFSKFDEISIERAIEFDHVDLHYSRFDQGFFSGIDIRDSLILWHSSSLFTRIEK